MDVDVVHVKNVNNMEELQKVLKKNHIKNTENLLEIPHEM